MRSVRTASSAVDLLEAWGGMGGFGVQANRLKPPVDWRILPGLTHAAFAMKPSPTNWVLLLSRAGQRLRVVPLADGSATIGRDSDNQIPLPHTSVSRRHAEIICGAGGVKLRDLGSRNGVLVNGVPRKTATLQVGDRLTICEFVLELAASAPAGSETTMAAPVLDSILRVDGTFEQRVQLPAARVDRDLAALYYACFWVAEGIDEKELGGRCLGLLLEAFRAEEVQLYSATLALTDAVTATGGKAGVKLAAFLARRFQESREAAAIAGTDIGRHQRGVADYNYLVCPLTPAIAPPGPAPFVVVLRRSDQPDFSPHDRVLLQAVCQLWIRGAIRTNQLADLRRQNQALKAKAGSVQLVGRSPAMTALLARAVRAAATNATVLITGETGSGKEVLAQYLHEHSPRADGPLIKLNCAAIPESLIESELFGYAKGAFSGAIRDHRGRFAQAQGGTLFLDEIGEMPLSVQAKVLRAIENREVQPLGSEATQKIDLRIVAATHRDLAQLVQERTFREDLFYRLDVQNLHVPPLRERPEDLEELIPCFLAKTSVENGLADLAFAPEAIAELQQHSWPGNVRELWNVVQRCALAAGGTTISREEAITQIRRRAGPRQPERF